MNVDACLHRFPNLITHITAEALLKDWLVGLQRAEASRYGEVTEATNRRLLISAQHCTLELAKWGIGSVQGLQNIGPEMFATFPLVGWKRIIQLAFGWRKKNRMEYMQPGELHDLFMRFIAEHKGAH